MEKIIAEKGRIYEWRNENDRRYCLVVSSNIRSQDKLISVIFISEDNGHFAPDKVLCNFNGTPYAIRTGLVTYTKRQYLMRQVGGISTDTMRRVNDGMLKNLGLCLDDNMDWKSMYYSLLDALAEKQSKLHSLVDDVQNRRSKK